MVTKCELCVIGTGESTFCIMLLICSAAGRSVNSLYSNMKHGVGVPAEDTPRAALHMPVSLRTQKETSLGITQAPKDVSMD